MFGKKKSKQMKEEQEKEIPEVRIYQKPKPVEEKPAEPVKKPGIARIVGAEWIDGTFRYIIVSNRELGNIGEVFELDEED